MKNKLFTLLFAVLASTSFCNATMVYGTCGDNLTWELNTLTGVLAIDGAGKMHDWTDDSPAPWDEYKYDIHSVTFPNFITKIGDRAFYFCTGLMSVTIPNYVDSIGKSAFEECTFLSPVTIGNHVTHIGDRAFYHCATLSSIVIPNSVTSMGEDVFGECLNLSSVTIGSRLTTIPGTTFGNCTSLSSITIPDNITCIGHGAFAYCTNLHSISIPNSVTVIEGDAFGGCSSLTSVTFPNSIDSIGDAAFSSCENLNAVHISDLAAWCNISFYNDNANPLYYAHNLYLNGQLITDLSIPANITTIKSSAFNGCNMTSVTMPNSVKEIGVAAFAQCNNIKSIAISEGVTKIGGGAFYDCDSLTSVTIPNSVDSIGQEAFAYCHRLESVTMGTGIKSIGNLAFAWCDSLKAVHISDLEAWCRIDFGANYNDSNPLVIAHNLYLNGQRVTDLVIPEGIDSIHIYAFKCCNMTSLTIPQSVVCVGGEAFAYCDSLKSITCYATNPPYTQIGYNFYVTNRFDGVDKANCILYVPEESISLYESELDWSLFENILPIGTTIEFNTLDIDLTTAAEMAYTGCSATPSVTDDVLTVNYSAGSWQWAGVEFPLDNLTNIINISFDYQGNGDNVVIYPYLRDSQGTRWTKGGYYLNLNNTEWQSETTYLPNATLWDAASYEFGEQPFVQLGFIANPGTAIEGNFKLRNIKIEYREITPPTAIEEIDQDSSAIRGQKILRDGQLFILRGDRVYTLQGHEVR